MNRVISDADAAADLAGLPRHVSLPERLADEADQCRHDGANDIAMLLMEGAIEIRALAVRVAELEADAARWRFLLTADCPTVCVMDDESGDWVPVHPKNITAVVDAEMASAPTPESQP